MQRTRKFARITESNIDMGTTNFGLSLTEIFDRFMTFKRTQGLAKRTLDEYEIHFRYFLDYLKGHVSLGEVTVDRVLGYIAWMIHDKNLAPMTVNVRLRTLRAFLRYLHLEGLIPKPIHDKIRLLKTTEDTIQSFSTTEIQLLLRQIDTSTYVGYRDFTMVCTLLDTMVRISELLTMR